MRSMQIDSDGWGGEGTFTAVLLEALKSIEAIEYLRVEDAPASRAEPGYAFLSNEIYVRFRTDSREVDPPSLRRSLAGDGGGQADDVSANWPPAWAAPTAWESRTTATTRCCSTCAPSASSPPTRPEGIKVVEMVRIYEVGTTPRRDRDRLANGRQLPSAADDCANGSRPAGPDETRVAH